MKHFGLLFACACLIATSAPAETLRILNWDEYIDPKVLDDFTTETGIGIEYDEYSSGEITEAFIVSGEADYDLIVVASEYFGRLLATGSIQPIDSARLSGRKHLRDDVMSRFDAISGVSTHAVPYLWGTTGIGFDSHAVEERMLSAPTDSWAMIFDPDIVSRFADCGVSILDAPEEMITIALNYLGYDPATSDPEHLAAAEALLADIAPFVSTFDTEQTSRLATGEACLAVAWSGDVLSAADQQADGIDIRYSVPREGAPIWFDMLVVPSISAASEGTYRFLEFLLRPEVISRITNYVWYPSPNAAAEPYLDLELLENPAVHPSTEQMKKLYVIPSRPGADKRTIARIWRRLKLVH